MGGGARKEGGGRREKRGWSGVPVSGGLMSRHSRIFLSLSPFRRLARVWVWLQLGACDRLLCGGNRGGRGVGVDGRRWKLLGGGGGGGGGERTSQLSGGKNGG